jgi:hypothetical protein
VNGLQKIKSFLHQLYRGCRFYRVSYTAALLRSLYLYFLSKFSLKEIIGYGLFAPPMTAKFPVLISKERSLSKLSVLNPRDLQHLTEDKDEFYRLCREQLLPVPETYGWTKKKRRYDARGQLIESEPAWIQYLSARLPGDFIIKDRAGTYGSGFAGFQRIGHSFQELGSGKNFDIEGLRMVLDAAGGYGGIIIQERLFDERSLSTLSGHRGLQTMRVNTLLNHDGNVTVLFYMIKILGGRTLSDNFSMGTTGNLIAYGDPETGILEGAVNIHDCGSGMKTVEMHPETRIPFRGFRVPHWTAAIELATRGQRCFSQLPTLGWDIALTETGPVIIEANSRWDPPLYAPFLMSSKNWKRIFS